MNNIMKKIINNRGMLLIPFLTTCLLLIKVAQSLPQRGGGGGNKDTCEVDADCQTGGQTNKCCSQFYYCGTGPDFCAEGCTFPDVEFVGGDLSKSQGGGGVTIRYDDACIIKCEENPKCQFFTYDYDTQQCYLKSALGEKRDINEKGKVLSGGLDKDNCEPELKCEPPYKKVNLQCVLVPEDENGNKTDDANKKKKTYQKTVETCHIFEGSLPNYLLSNAQLNPSGIPPKELPNTLLQGNLAPDLFGIRSRRSADYTQEDPLEIEECFLDPSEIEIKYERRLISNRLREYDSQSCYEDVIITGISEDLMEGKGNKSAKLERPSISAFQDEPIYKAFPSLNTRPVTDRWSWLNYPKRDDEMCVATLPGFAGKYRLFPCDSELYMVCERRNPSYPRPLPPIIKKLPTRPISGNNGNRNTFIGSKPSPSFGIGTSTIGKSDPSFRSVSTLPRPVPPREPNPISTANFNSVVFQRPVANYNPKPVREEVPVLISKRKNPFIQLHDKIADIMKRRRLLYALTARRFD